MENLYLIEKPSAHGVSEVYKMLIDPPVDYVPRFIEKWESDLDTTFSKEQ